MSKKVLHVCFSVGVRKLEFRSFCLKVKLFLKYLLFIYSLYFKKKNCYTLCMCVDLSRRYLS